MHPTAPRGRRLALAGALLAIGAVMGPASGAAAAPAPAPASIAVVQNATASLEVSEEDGSLCLRILLEGRDEASSCDSAGDGNVVVSTPGAGPAYVGAAVMALAATVEVRRAGRLLAAAPTVDGARLPGTQARAARYALLRLPAGARVDGLRIRALDGTGVVRQVLAGAYDEDLVSARRTLMSGRSGAVRWRLTSERRSSSSPSLADLDHETRRHCVRTTVVAQGGSRSSQTCVGDTPADTLVDAGQVEEIGAEERCEPAFRLVRGIVEGRATVSVLRGDGRRVAARTARLPGVGYTAYAVVVPAADAVRAVRIHASGQPARTLRTSSPPLPVACALKTVFDGLSVSLGLPALLASLTPVTPVGPQTTVPGPPPFRVADGPGQSLCLALGERPFTPLGCRVVAPGYEDVMSVTDELLDPHAAALALPAEVATVRVRDGAGTIRDIATVSADGYDGPYAGRARFAALTFSGSDDVQGIELLDAAGRVLHDESADPTGVTALAPSTAIAAQRVAGRAGGPSLWQSGYDYGARAFRCVALTDGPPPPDGEGCRVTRTGIGVLLRASCTTRRLTVAVTAPAGARVVATTAGGRRLPITLRGGAGLLTLPRSAGGVRTLTIDPRAGRTRRIALRAPAATRQCGWQDAASV